MMIHHIIHHMIHLNQYLDEIRTFLAFSNQLKRKILRSNFDLIVIKSLHHCKNFLYRNKSLFRVLVLLSNQFIIETVRNHLDKYLCRLPSFC